jgi:hypothetical protein
VYSVLPVPNAAMVIYSGPAGAAARTTGARRIGVSDGRIVQIGTVEAPYDPLREDDSGGYIAAP